jgi:hypothetical protein
MRFDLGFRRHDLALPKYVADSYIDVESFLHQRGVLRVRLRPLRLLERPWLLRLGLGITRR